MYIKNSQYQAMGSPSKIEGELTHSCFTILSPSILEGGKLTHSCLTILIVTIET